MNKLRPIINIGLDADDFIFDTEKYTNERAIEYFMKHFGLEVKNPNGYNIKEKFECTEEQQTEFWKSFFLHYSLFAKPRANFLTMLKALKSHPDADIHFYIVTSKYKAFDPLIGKIVRAAFETGLEIQGIRPYIDRIIYCSLENSVEDKRRACIENNLVIFGDDSAKNILGIKDVTNAICMNTPNNRDIDLGDIPRIDNFNQFYVECMKIIDSIIKTNSIFSRFQKLDRLERQQLDANELEEYYRMYAEYIRQLPFNTRKMLNGETFQRIMYYTYGTYFKLQHKPIIIGRELVPRNEPVIFVSNHQGPKDFKLILAGMGDIPWHPLLKEEFQQMGFNGKLLDWMYAAYVNRSVKSSRADSLLDMMKMSSNGGNILFMAEGTYTSKLTQTENVGPLQPGYCYAAQVLNRRIVPMSLTQDYLHRLTPVIRFSEPIKINYDSDIDNENERIRNIISSGIEENKRLQLKL